MAFFLGDNGINLITGTANADQVFARGGNDTVNTLAGADFVDAGNGNDTVNAGQGDDVVLGGNGNDILNGDGGDDVLLGGAGRDTLRGGTGDDVLVGGDGRDILIGGAGADHLEGGNGGDFFAYALLAQSAPGHVDVIEDFSKREGDKLDLRDLNLDRSGPDRDIISILHQGGDTFVRVNTDNDAAQEFVVKLEGNVNLRVADLLL
jgi:Ca2+-binding RTX toxin-like protein